MRPPEEAVPAAARAVGGGPVSVAAMSDEKEEQEEPLAAGAAARWGPMAPVGDDHASVLQHARLMMLLLTTRHAGLKVDKWSLGANWMLDYQALLAKRSPDTTVATKVQPCPATLAPVPTHHAAVPFRSNDLSHQQVVGVRN